MYFSFLSFFAVFFYLSLSRIFVSHFFLSYSCHSTPHSLSLFLYLYLYPFLILSLNFPAISSFLISLSIFFFLSLSFLFIYSFSLLYSVSYFFFLMLSIFFFIYLSVSLRCIAIFCSMSTQPPPLF